MSGDSYEKYDEVLDQAVENGYNTIRIDPLPHAIELKNPKKMITRQALADQPIHPWDRASAFEGKAGAWLIEFIQKLKERNLGLAMVIGVGGVVGGRCVGLQNVGVDAA